MLVAICCVGLVSFALSLYAAVYFLLCSRRNIIINYNFAIVKIFRKKKLCKVVMRTKKAYFGKNKKLNTQFFIKNAKNLLFALKPEYIYSCNTHSAIIKQLEKHKSFCIISIKPKLLGSSLAIEKAAINGTSLTAAIITGCFCKNKTQMFRVFFKRATSAIEQ